MPTTDYVKAQILRVAGPPHTSQKIGCGFFAYNWKLPAYSGAFLLTVDNFSFFTYNWSFSAYNFSFLTCSWSFFAYSGKVRLKRALRDCKQRSLTVSKKAPTVSKRPPPYKFGLILTHLALQMGVGLIIMIESLM